MNNEPPKPVVLACTVCPTGPCITAYHCNSYNTTYHNYTADKCYSKNKCKAICCWTCCLPCNLLYHIIFTIWYVVFFIISLILDIIYLVIFAVPTLIIHRIKTGTWFFKPQFYFCGMKVKETPRNIDPIYTLIYLCSCNCCTNMCCKAKDIEYNWTNLAYALGCACFYDPEDLIDSLSG